MAQETMARSGSALGGSCKTRVARAGEGRLGGEGVGDGEEIIGVGEERVGLHGPLREALVGCSRRGPVSGELATKRDQCGHDGGGLRPLDWFHWGERTKREREEWETA